MKPGGAGSRAAFTVDAAPLKERVVKPNKQQTRSLPDKLQTQTSGVKLILGFRGSFGLQLQASALITYREPYGDLGTHLKLQRHDIIRTPMTC